MKIESEAGLENLGINRETLVYHTAGAAQASHDLSIAHLSYGGYSIRLVQSKRLTSSSVVVGQADLPEWEQTLFVESPGSLGRRQ